MEASERVDLARVDGCGVSTVDAYGRLTLASTFASSASVRLSSAVVGVAPAMLYAVSPAFVTPFGSVFDWAGASVAPWPAVAVGYLVAFMSSVVGNHA